MSDNSDNEAGMDLPDTPPEQTFRFGGPPTQNVAVPPPPVPRPANGAAAGPVIPPPPPAPLPPAPIPPAPLPPMPPLALPPPAFGQHPLGLQPPQPIQPHPLWQMMNQINPQNVFMNPFAGNVSDDTEEYDSEATSVASGDGFKFKHFRRRQI